MRAWMESINSLLRVVRILQLVIITSLAILLSHKPVKGSGLASLAEI
nr:hypothetical protein [Nitrosomonas communis]